MDTLMHGLREGVADASSPEHLETILLSFFERLSDRVRAGRDVAQISALADEIDEHAAGAVTEIVRKVAELTAAAEALINQPDDEDDEEPIPEHPAPPSQPVTPPTQQPAARLRSRAA